MLRILHLPTPVGGMPYGLSRAERSFGVDSRVLYAQSGWLKYPCDIDLEIDKCRNDFFRLVRLVDAFFSIRNQFDVFHFNWGSSLINLGRYGFPQIDIPFYPKRVKLFVTYNGCDARQKYATMRMRSIAACHEADCYKGICNSGKMDRIRRQNIKKMTSRVRHVWAVNPDLLNFLPAEKSTFLPYAIADSNLERHVPNFKKKKLTVVHAPTDRGAKGTPIILKTLENLKRKHPDRIDVLLIEGVSHENALKLYEKADLVIDQILVGWYGSFAVELMMMGKPVICRIEERDLKFIPSQMAHDIEDAFIHADPFTIFSVVERCLDDRLFLKAKSAAGMDFARKWHDSRWVASITLEQYLKD